MADKVAETSPARMLGTSQPPGPNETVASVVQRRSSWPLIALAVAAVVGIGALTIGSDPAAEEEAANEPATATTLARPAPVAVPDENSVDGNSTEHRTRAVSAAIGGSGVQLVLTDRGGSDPLLVRYDNQEAQVVALPDLHNLDFDRSGQWLAGMAFNRVGSTSRSLWAGDGEAMDPVFVGVRSFAWHDSEPALLAWSGMDRNVVHVLDLANSQARTVQLEEVGRLNGWGNWGFSVTTDFRPVRSALLNPVGQTLATDLVGTFGGTLPDGRLVFSGGGSDLGEESPTAFDAASGATVDLADLADGDFVWDLTSPTQLDASIALVDRNGLQGEFGGEIYAVAADGEWEPVAEVAAFTELAVGPTTGRVAYVAQGDETPSELNILQDGTWMSMTIPSIGDHHFVVALSLLD